jgi:hypothetical protein
MMSLSRGHEAQANLLASNVLARDCEKQHPVMNHVDNPCHACNSSSRVILSQDALLDLTKKKDLDEV